MIIYSVNGLMLHLIRAFHSNRCNKKVIWTNLADPQHWDCAFIQSNHPPIRNCPALPNFFPHPLTIFSSFESNVFDYMVVSGGTAGGLLASRLAHTLPSSFWKCVQSIRISLILLFLDITYNFHFRRYAFHRCQCSTISS